MERKSSEVKDFHYPTMNSLNITVTIRFFFEKKLLDVLEYLNRNYRILKLDSFSLRSHILTPVSHRKLAVLLLRYPSLCLGSFKTYLAAEIVANLIAGNNSTIYVSIANEITHACLVLIKLGCTKRDILICTSLISFAT